MSARILLVLILIVSFIGALTGCNSGPTDPVSRELLLSGHPLDRKIGQVIQKIKPFEPTAILTFAHKGLNGAESQGLVIQARDNNIYFSRVFEENQLFRATKFTFFPDTLIRVALRDFPALSQLSTEECETQSPEDVLYRSTFWMNDQFYSMEMFRDKEIACNQDNPKAQFLLALSQKFEILPPQ